MSMTTWIVLAVIVYVVAVVGVGALAAKGAGRTQESFFVADRNLGWIPEGMSIYATIVSGAVFTGTVGLFYGAGIDMLGYGLGYAILMPILYYLVGSQVRRFSRFHRYQTQAEIFGDMFDSRFLRAGAAFGGVLFLIPYFAVNAVAMGLVLESGIDLPYQWGVFLFLVLTLSYSVVGGLRSVAYTDVANGVIALAFTVVTVIVMWSLAGWGDTITLEPQGVLSTDAAGVTTYMTWFFYIALSVIALPDRMLRMVSVRDDSNLKRAAILVCVALGLASFGYAIIGLATNILVPNEDATDTVLPQAIENFAPALLPFFVVTILATGMSTYNSGLITASNIVTRDLWLPVRRKAAARAGQKLDKNTHSRQGVLVGRILMVLLTIVAFVVAGTQPPFIWDLVNITLGFFLQFVPLLIAGVFWSRASRVAAEVAFVVGVLTCFYWTFMATAPFGFQAGLVSLIVNAAVLVVITLIRGATPAERERRRRFTRAGLAEEDPAQPSAPQPSSGT